MSESDEARTSGQKQETIAFPSDRITVGALRNRFRGRFETLEIVLHDMFMLEAEIVNYLGVHPSKTPRASEHTRNLLNEERAKELAGLYVELGVASGTRQAMRLIDDFQVSVRHRSLPDRS